MKIAVSGPDEYIVADVASRLSTALSSPLATIIDSYIAPHLAPLFSLTANEILAQRKRYRLEFRSMGDKLRVNNQTILVSQAITTGDIVTGIKSHHELSQSLKAGLLNLCVWVEGGNEQDPSLDFDGSCCDLTIDMTRDLPLADKVSRIANVIKGPAPVPEPESVKGQQSFKLRQIIRS